MASKKTNKATVFTTNYVFCVYGGAMKVGLCYVTSGETHPETSLQDLKKYYGSEIKGYYCKTVDSLESISNKLSEELKDKSNLSEYLYEVKVTDIKKIIKTVADSKTGSTMGPMKAKKTDDDDDEEDDEEEEEKPEPAKKATKETKAKDSKVKDEKKDEKKVETTKKPATKDVKETKDTKDTKKPAAKKVVKEEAKSNRTVIDIDDDSDDEDEDD